MPQALVFHITSLVTYNLSLTLQSWERPSWSLRMYSWVMVSVCVIYILSIWFISWDLLRNCASISDFICENFDFLYIISLIYVVERLNLKIWVKTWVDSVRSRVEANSILSIWVWWPWSCKTWRNIFIRYNWYDSLKWQSFELNEWQNLHWFLLVCLKHVLTKLFADFVNVCGCHHCKPSGDTTPPTRDT